MRIGATANIHELAVTFLRVQGVEERLEALENALREDFGAERAVLLVFQDQTRPEVTRPGFVKVVNRDDESLKSFSTQDTGSQQVWQTRLKA